MALGRCVGSCNRVRCTAHNGCRRDGIKCRDRVYGHDGHDPRSSSHHNHSPGNSDPCGRPHCDAGGYHDRPSSAGCDNPGA